MPLTSGTRLGPYEILSPIGAGGPDEVYEAEDSGSRCSEFSTLAVQLPVAIYELRSVTNFKR